MSRLPALLIPLLLAGAFAAMAGESAHTVDPSGRVISIGGDVTEIVAALGAADRLVARDTTSSYPPDIAELPDIGYMRSLSAEGVLSLSPGLILATEGAGPPEVVDILARASVPLVTVPDDITPEGVAAKIEVVAGALGRDGEGRALARRVAAEIAEARSLTADVEAPKRVLFVLSAAGGRLMVAGDDTSAGAMIDLAGADNAMTGFTGFKPAADEAVIAAAPDVILMMDRGGDHGIAADDLFALPAIAATPAGEARALVIMDGLFLLGFGPRTGRAVEDLAIALYPEVADTAHRRAER